MRKQHVPRVREQDGAGAAIADAKAPRRALGTLVDILVASVALLGALAATVRYAVEYGKSLVWAPDGIAQHYPSLYFLNHWLRAIVRNPRGGVALWSWSLGMGADIPTSLAFYVFGDPFALLVAGYAARNIESYLVLALVLRVLAAGLAALWYFRRMGARALPALTGSVLYVFTVYLYGGTLHHPMFLTAGVALPLVLLGVENVFARRSPWTLTVFVFFGAMANYYFFYMITIIAGVYAIARYFELAEKTDRWRLLLPTALRMAAYYFAGLLLAAPLLLPAILSVLNSVRGQHKPELPLLYALREYRALLPSVFSGAGAANSTWLGFGMLGLLAAAVAVVRRGSNVALKFMLLAFGVAVALPAAGSLFNGFTFPSNRFAFGWGLFFGAIVALVMTERRPFTRRELLAAGVGLGGYTAAVLVFVQEWRSAYVLPIVFGGLTLAVFAYEASGSSVLGEGGPRWLPARWREPLTRWLVFALLLVNVVTNAAFTLDIRYGDGMRDFVDAGKVRDYYTSSNVQLAESLPDDHFYRVADGRRLTDDPRSQSLYNTPLVAGYAGTSFYFSVMNGWVTQYLDETDIITGWSSFSFYGFDDRVTPNALAAVEYYVTKQGSQRLVPYGFTKYAEKNSAVAYRNVMPLPFGFVYDSAIDRSAYEKLDSLDQQQAMLQGAVIDDSELTAVPRVAPAPVAVDLPFSAETTGCTLDMERNEIVRLDEKARVDLSVAPVPDSELYVEITGIKNTVESPEEVLRRKLGSDASKIDMVAAEQEAEDSPQPINIPTRFSSDGVAKTLGYRTPQHPYYWGHDSQLVNLGYRQNGADGVAIEPRGIGTLEFDSLKVWALPMANYRDRVAALQSQAVTDLVVAKNRVEGTVTPSKAGIAFLSIPYSAGWTATVDGKPVDTVRVNTAFTGIPVEAGTHRLRLKYRTPGLVAGLYVSLVTAVIFVLVQLFLWMRARRR